MSAYLDWLEDINERDSRVRAVLRRSLAFDPGTFPAAFPYVEPFLKEDGGNWRRQVHYLVAALWASHWKAGREGAKVPVAIAVAHYAMAHHTREQLNGRASSTERRFITLLDADTDELPYRLRQMVRYAASRGVGVHWPLLFFHIHRWNALGKGVQKTWARSFFGNEIPEGATQTTEEGE